MCSVYTCQRALDAGKKGLYVAYRRKIADRGFWARNHEYEGNEYGDYEERPSVYAKHFYSGLGVIPNKYAFELLFHRLN